MDGIDKATDKSMANLEALGLSKREPLKKPQLGQEDFMKLMLAQMKHQDPTKPVENTQFVGQMAQFSSLQGIKEMKDSFQTLATTLQSAQALQASSMVGRQVLIPGKTVDYVEGNALRGAVDVATEAEQVNVKIFDSQGQLVKTLDLGKRGEGLVNFSWDGVINKAPANAPSTQPVTHNAASGKYTVQADVIVDGKAQAASTYVTDKVNSVSLGKANQGVTLNLSNSGSMSLTEIREIL